jgi:hypothetical protein
MPYFSVKLAKTGPLLLMHDQPTQNIQIGCMFCAGGVLEHVFYSTRTCLPALPFAVRTYRV